MHRRRKECFLGFVEAWRLSSARIQLLAGVDSCTSRGTLTERSRPPPEPNTLPRNAVVLARTEDLGACGTSMN